MEEKKDYSLLRPFDLEAAKRGDAVIDIDGDIVTYIGGPSEKGEFCVDIGSLGFGLCEAHELRMAPLAWVEGKPVYKGDVLYSSFFHGMEECKDGIFEVTGVDGNGQFLAGKLSKKHATQFESCSWTPPKVKREGWVNVYPSYGAWTKVCKDKAKADLNAAPNRIACIRIEWEEPAA